MFARCGHRHRALAIIASGGYELTARAAMGADEPRLGRARIKGQALGRTIQKRRRCEEGADARGRYRSGCQREDAGSWRRTDDAARASDIAVPRAASSVLIL